MIHLRCSQRWKWTSRKCIWGQYENFCCSVTKSCLTLCDPMDCITSCFPVVHHLPEFVQTHVHWTNDAIQPSHPLSPASPLALTLSQASGSFPMSLFSVLGGQSIGASASASIFPMNTQYINFLINAIKFSSFQRTKTYFPSTSKL